MATWAPPIVDMIIGYFPDICIAFSMQIKLVFRRYLGPQSQFTKERMRVLERGAKKRNKTNDAQPSSRRTFPIFFRCKKVAPLRIYIDYSLYLYRIAQTNRQICVFSPLSPHRALIWDCLLVLWKQQRLATGSFKTSVGFGIAKCCETLCRLTLMMLLTIQLSCQITPPWFSRVSTNHFLSRKYKHPQISTRRQM